MEIGEETTQMGNVRKSTNIEANSNETYYLHEMKKNRSLELNSYNDPK